MPAAIEIDAELSRRGVSSLMRQMQATAKALNISLASTVKFAGWAVTDAFRTATGEAPKKRKLTELKTGRAVLTRLKTGNRTFVGVEYRRGGLKTFEVFAKDKREANKLEHVKISNRGLARKTWHFPQRKLGSGRGGRRVSASASKVARRHGTVELHLSGDNPWIKIENSLDYAVSAFKTSGQQTIDNVGERAARRMQKITAAKVAKKMGAK